MTGKIGIMGGTFDPIHNGHIAIAKSAAEQLGLQRMLFIPTGNPHFKLEQKVTDASVRTHMVELAIADDERFVLDRCEVDRPGVTYTADTLEELAARYPDTELYFVMGADSAMTLHHWRNAERVAELCTVAVVQRPGQTLEEVHDAIEKSPIEFSVTCVEAPQVDVSSTQIRELVSRGESIEALVPQAVAEFIEQTGLYKE